MAKKVPYSKLQTKLIIPTEEITFKDSVIEVKTYLPIQEKLALMERVIEYSHEPESNYSNPVKTEIYLNLEVLFTYTNIAFTDKQREDVPKLYDEVVHSGLLDAVLGVIPQSEYEGIAAAIKKAVKAIYRYQNSVMGVLDIISNDYENTNLDVIEIGEKLKNLDNVDLIKDVLTKIG